MNRRLLDPFQSVQPPELIEEYLEPRGGIPCITTCLAFNRRGTILAGGTHDGQVILWDWDTRAEARVLQGHSDAIVGVCWSRNGRYLASACAGGLLILWDVLEATPEVELALPCGATWVSLTARRPYKCLVSLVQGPPLLIDLEESKQQRRIPMFSASDLKLKRSRSQGGEGDKAQGGTVRRRGKLLLPHQVQRRGQLQGGGRRGGGSPGGGGGGGGGGGEEAGEQGLPGVAVFSKAGDMVLVGYAKGGLLAVLDTETLQHVDLIKLSNVAQVQGLVFNRRATLLLANCHDKTLRMFSIAGRKQHSLSPGGTSQQHGGANGDAGSQQRDLVPLETVRSKVHANTGKAPKTFSLLHGDGGGVLIHQRDFCSPVERCSWASTCFSADSEHVVAAAASKTQHHIYLWNVQGRMDKVMEGPADGASVIAWHPLRTWLCTAGNPTSRVYIWGRAYAENWSAFAPDFKELEENTEYVEAEDEFDQLPDKVGSGAAGGQSTPTPLGSPELEVDVLGMAPDCVFTSDEEDEEGSPDEQQLHHLPVEIEPEEEEAPEQLLEEEEAGVKLEGVEEQGMEGMQALPEGGQAGGQPGGQQGDELQQGAGSEMMLVEGPSDPGIAQGDEGHMDGQLDDGAWLDGMVVEAEGGLADQQHYSMLMDP